jgi:6-pyruvoyltetrahydropterin/6-carboxytetrahydropterin synthase
MFWVFRFPVTGSCAADDAPAEKVEIAAPAGFTRGFALESAMRIYKEFHFEAAHYLPSAEPGTANARVHGHSFRARVTLEGEPDAATGYVVHFGDLGKAIAAAHSELDHRLLNEVPGLAAPTLERIAIWLWNRLDASILGLAEIVVARDSCHEGCIYTGPSNRRPS